MKKIDIVYLWVDGSDKKWLDKKNHYDSIPSKEVFSNVNGRFRNSDELIYSLRSLDMYFPEHGDVYIVTDNQKHHLLNENKVKYISHEEIMDQLPTFSSKKIASNIFKIKCSEDLLFFNDDVFLGPKFSIYNFLDKEKYGIQYEQDKDKKGYINEENMNLSISILQRKYNTNNFTYKNFQHSPKIINRKLFSKYVNEFKEEHDKLQKEIFRDRTNPPFIDMYYRWLQINNLSVSKDAEYLYFEFKGGNDIFDILFREFNNIEYFCLNDATDNQFNLNEKINIFQEKLSLLYPNKSRYEK